ncbi:hypothetical protein MRX96_023559 [Rhipicephalus microplus]
MHRPYPLRPLARAFHLSSHRIGRDSNVVSEYGTPFPTGPSEPAGSQHAPAIRSPCSAASRAALEIEPVTVVHSIDSEVRRTAAAAIRPACANAAASSVARGNGATLPRSVGPLHLLSPPSQPQVLFPP